MKYNAVFIMLLILTLTISIDVVNAEILTVKSNEGRVVDGSVYVEMFLPKPENASILPDLTHNNLLKSQTATQPPNKEIFWIYNNVTGQWERHNATLKKRVNIVTSMLMIM